MKCKIQVQNKDCGEPLTFQFEGHEKYNIYLCKTHGLVSVLKEREQ